MNALKRYAERLSEKLDLPRSVTAGLPQTVVDGCREVTIDLQKGLLCYSETEITVAVTFGTVTVSGTKLRIRLMKEEKIVIIGEINTVTFGQGNMK